MENDNIYKSKSLPQISAPFSYVAHHLNDMGQPYELVGASVDSINPSQGFIDSDIVGNFVDKLKNGEELKAIWLDKDNNALDGHHRYVAYLLNKNSHIPSVRLSCDKETGVKLLNDIQSKYDNENNSDFLNALSEEHDTSMYFPEKTLPTKKQVVIAYRNKENPYNERSISGIFFSLRKIPNSVGKEIELESAINSDIISPAIKKDKNPPAALAKIWFPSLDFEAKAKEFQMNLGDFINVIVAEKARTKGIDGILYGDKLLQTIGPK